MSQTETLPQLVQGYVAYDGGPVAEVLHVVIVAGFRPTLAGGI